MDFEFETVRFNVLLEIFEWYVEIQCPNGTWLIVKLYAIHGRSLTHISNEDVNKNIGK